MAIYLVEHRWGTKRSGQSKSFVSKVVDVAASEKLPRGYELIGAVVNSDDTCAECVWEAPTKSELENFIDSMKPPTIHTISEAQVVYGLERIVKAA